MMLPWALLVPAVYAQVKFTGNSETLAPGISILAFNISANIEKIEKGNFVWSPYSAHSAFTQVLLGSAGETQKELEQALGLSSESTSEYQRLDSKLKSENSTLRVSNLLAIAKGFKPLESYTAQLKSRFGSQVLELDFITEKRKSAKQLSDIVANTTNNKIVNFIKEDSLPDSTRLMIINAVYFKGLWRTPFKRERIFNSTFTTPSGEVRVEYLRGTLEVKLLEEETYSILELPYLDQNKALLIVLPKEGESTDGIIANLKNIKLSAIRNESLEETDVQIPKFKISFQFTLKPLMAQAGVESLFSPAADLKGISAEPISVSDAIQQAFIEVNEEGTEAAAATALFTKFAAVQQPRQFRANRPFVFIVYDFAANIPLFMGKIVDPRGKNV